MHADGPVPLCSSQSVAQALKEKLAAKLRSVYSALGSSVAKEVLKDSGTGGDQDEVVRFLGLIRKGSSVIEVASKLGGQFHARHAGNLTQKAKHGSDCALGDRHLKYPFLCDYGVRQQRKEREKKNGT